MKYNHAQRYLNKGEVVRVRLDKQANVLLLDSTNYSRFKSGREYKGYGGLAKASPCHIEVPFTGIWHVVIHLGGYRGSVKYSIDVTG